MGNLLCRDEGIGVHIIQAMENMELPNHIELLDIGTSTMDLISHLEGVREVDCHRCHGGRRNPWHDL